VILVVTNVLYILLNVPVVLLIVNYLMTKLSVNVLNILFYQQMATNVFVGKILFTISKITHVNVILIQSKLIINALLVIAIKVVMDAMVNIVHNVFLIRCQVKID
jgi:hypothetical protein